MSNRGKLFSVVPLSPENVLNNWKQRYVYILFELNAWQ